MPSATAPTRPDGRPLRLAHLATVDLSLANLLGTELSADVEAGFEVYGLSAPGPYAGEIEALGATHVPVPSLTRTWDPGRDAFAMRELVGGIRRLGLDVLHTHTPKAGVMGRLAGRLAGVPVVVNTCHGLWVRPDDSPVKKALVYGVEGLASLLSDAELYQNAQDRRTLRRVVAPHRSATVGNGVDLQRFRPDAAGRRRVRAELGVADDQLLVGGVGRLVAEKGIREYAEVARALADRATFVWAGHDEPDKPDRLEADLDGVRFLGVRRDMPALYSALDVFVLPSHREGFSRSAMEAAACGCTLVLSDIRGCREIGVHDDHLLLTPSRDPGRLRGAVARLLDDPALRARLGKAARARAVDAFDQRAVARCSMAAYRIVAGRKGLGWRGV